MSRTYDASEYPPFAVTTDLVVLTLWRGHEGGLEELGVSLDQAFGLRRGTRPSWVNSAQDPSNRSGLLRVGIIRPSTYLECAAVITNLDRNVRDPSSSMILRGGNVGRAAPRHHGPGQPDRRIGPLHPTRSTPPARPTPVAGISGVSSINAQSSKVTTLQSSIQSVDFSSDVSV